MVTTRYTLRRYSDNQAIGSGLLTDQQFVQYMAMAQQPQAIIRLGSLPHDLYDLEPEFQGESAETIVWFE